MKKLQEGLRRLIATSIKEQYKDGFASTSKSIYVQRLKAGQFDLLGDASQSVVAD
jgi:hypothetical protein